MTILQTDSNFSVLEFYMFDKIENIAENNLLCPFKHPPLCTEAGSPVVGRRR